ncbi:MAG: tetratricopeptide repeat protein, partial [Candidatus Sumerlaeaceae bacterium]|nr:tetratricopeptide repeat protein [Candidatus Sumerlaeaceae bacterium]
RESKYLHNWALQIGAETGLIGLSLFAATIVLVFKCLSYNRRTFYDEASVLAALMVMFLIDSLVELSFNQRELMATFGACCGLAIGLHEFGESRDKCKSLVCRNILIAAMTFLIGLAVALVALPRAMQCGFLEMAEGTLETGEDTLAQGYLKQAQFWGRRDAKTYILGAALARQSADAALEEQALRRALELTPWSASLHVQLAEVLERCGKLSEAEQLLRRAVELYPTKAEHWHELACFLERQGRIPEAYEAARKAVEYSYLYPERDRALLRRIEERLYNISSSEMNSGTMTTHSNATSSSKTISPR